MDLKFSSFFNPDIYFQTGNGQSYRGRRWLMDLKFFSLQHVPIRAVSQMRTDLSTQLHDHLDGPFHRSFHLDLFRDRLWDCSPDFYFDRLERQKAFDLLCDDEFTFLNRILYSNNRAIQQLVGLFDEFMADDGLGFDIYYHFGESNP